MESLKVYFNKFNNPFTSFLRVAKNYPKPHQLWVNFCVLFSTIMISKKKRPSRHVRKVVLYYRISDSGYKKVKPDYITKENCLANAVKRFPHDKVEWYLMADNVCEETYNMILKYVPCERVTRVSVGHGAGTFRMVYESALQQPDDSLIYFLEDDYLHVDGAYEVLVNAAEKNLCDYYTLYDNPDKYDVIKPNNPFVCKGGEKSRVFWCKNHHWKISNSTTMTFATFVDILKRDKKIFWRWTSGKLPYDYMIFNDLRVTKNSHISSPIPSMSTHGETALLAPGISWEEQI